MKISFYQVHIACIISLGIPLHMCWRWICLHTLLSLHLVPWVWQIDISHKDNILEYNMALTFPWMLMTIEIFMSSPNDCRYIYLRCATFTPLDCLTLYKTYCVCYWSRGAISRCSLCPISDIYRLAHTCSVWNRPEKRLWSESPSGGRQWEKRLIRNLPAGLWVN